MCNNKYLDGQSCRASETYRNERRAKGLADLSHNLWCRSSIDILHGVALGLGTLGLGHPLAVNLLPLLHEHNRNGALGVALEEGLAQVLGKTVDNSVVGKEDVMVVEQLALGLVCLELGLEVGNVDDAGDAVAQVLGELFRSDNVLVVALRVGDDDADGRLVIGVQGVGEDDLGGLQTVGVGDVLLGGEGKPDRGLGNGRLLIGEKVLGNGSRGGGGLLDVGEEGLGSLGDLLVWTVSNSGRSPIALIKKRQTWLGSAGEATASDALTTAVDLDIFVDWERRYLWVGLV